MGINLSVNFAGVTLKNPVTTASGTCGFGEEYSSFYKSSDLGAISVKGLSLNPRLGNKVIRIAEVPSGILNSIGLQNPGVEYFIKNELPILKSNGTTVIANISGATVADYCKMAEILSETEVDMLEMNISCPNVKEGGVAFGVYPESIGNITEKVKKYSQKPLIVKLSPNVANISDNARAAEANGADGLSLINTLIGMKIDIKTRRPLLNNNIGGLSGPCVRPVAVRMVWQVRNAVKIPIIGMGGIETAEDAIEFFLAGANAIAIGTAAFTNPYAPIEILNGIIEYLKENNISDINDIVGTVIPY